ncbi:hypothetical protein OG874_00205 [Nocardia sp. NBC_00565]|uniref:hypothetical protein n=1 Tax=Nocardia sp. NBC_00565 TaxID=2975993 RepID=UPI002E8027DA|nr:hypothetical protein [Nocardia sp. NBC_00565]WUC03676.1 hypothetical protein OG874_00205 [Nocardia sp. NBC_00565]
MPDPTPLETALVEACEFAVAHGVDSAICPDDFAVQHRPPGIHAVFVNSDVAVIVVLDHRGTGTFGLADLDWLHFPDSENGTEPCGDYCTPYRPMETVYLPGDEPASATPRVEVTRA